LASPTFFAPNPNTPPFITGTIPGVSHRAVLPSIVHPDAPMSLHVKHLTTPEPSQRSHVFLLNPPCTFDPSGTFLPARARTDAR
jgi:hypothetical protein